MDPSRPFIVVRVLIIITSTVFSAIHTLSQIGPCADYGPDLSSTLPCLAD